MFNPEKLGPIERKSGLESVLPSLEKALGEASLEDRRLFHQFAGQSNRFLFDERESL